MSTTTRWWWIRHGPVNADGRIYGQFDLPADCSNRGLFKGTADRLPPGALWLTSHLQRTRQTAAAMLAERPALADGAATPEALLAAEPRLAEQHFGDWQGLTHAELAETRGDAWHRFWLTPAHETPPGGESFVDLIARVGSAITDHSAAQPERDIVAVAHGGTIRAALALALDLDPEKALAFAIDYCSLTCIDFIAGAPGSHDPEAKGVWRVTAVNISPSDSVD